MIRDVGKGMGILRPGPGERSDVEQFLTYFLGRKERKLTDASDSNDIVSPRYCTGLLGGFGVGSSESAFRIGDEMHLTTKIASSDTVAEVINSKVPPCRTTTLHAATAQLVANTLPLPPRFPRPLATR